MSTAQASAALHRLVVARETLEAEEQRLSQAIEACESRLLQIAQDVARESGLRGDAIEAIDQLDGEARA